MVEHMFSVVGNSNYAAVIVAYDPANEVPLEGRDRVVGYKVLGYQSIVGKGAYEPGQALIVFGAETQLSEAYASANNLYRHSERNADQDVKGYLDDTGRVKAIKLGGHRSDALVMPANSLVAVAQDYLGKLPEPGTVFDHIGDVEICRKYVIKVKGNGQSMSGRQGQKKVRVTAESFMEHFDTPNGFRQPDLIRPDEYVTVTQKLHGTSVRLANVPVLRDLKWYERLAQKVGVKVQTHEYGVVVGSRRTTKSINGEVESGKDHFYASDLWTEATKHMMDLIPHGFEVFAEIVGWTPDGAEIQKNYTYGVPVGQTRVYVYRVAVVNDQGDLVDLPWRAVERFCEARGWLYTPVLWTGLYEDFEPEEWMDMRFAESWTWDENQTPATLSHKSLPDEGVCVRADSGFTPTVLKFKSPAFLRHESVLLDEEAVDTEATEDVG